MKYIRPKSATFWIGILMIISGVLLVIDAFQPLGILGPVLTAAYGDMSPFMLIICGSGTVTMRAALPNIGGKK
jgi:hypothetical protein